MATETVQLFKRGVSAFNAQQFFDAHELWEEVWMTLDEGSAKTRCQGLIQVAVGLVHYQRNNPVGMNNLLQRARENLLAGNLAPVDDPETVLGLLSRVDWQRLNDQVTHLLTRLSKGIDDISDADMFTLPLSGS